MTLQAGSKAKFNTIIDLSTDLVDGEMTEEHRQLVELAVNEYSKEYYCKPAYKGVRFKGFILLDRNKISKKEYRGQQFRLAGVPAKRLEQLVESLTEGYKIYEAPPAVFLPKEWQREEHVEEGMYRYLTGYQRDECFETLGKQGISVTKIVVGLFEIDEDAEVDFKQIGTYLNPPISVSTPTNIGDLTKIALEELSNPVSNKLSFIHDENQVLDEVATMESIVTYMKEASPLSNYKEETYYKQAITVMQRSDKFWNHVRSYTVGTATDWMKKHCQDEYDENGTLKVHYHLISSSSGVEKSYLGPAKARLKMLMNSASSTTVTGYPLVDPDFEFRVVLFIPNLVWDKKFTMSANLSEAYNEGVRKFYQERKKQLQVICNGYTDGSISKNPRVKMYGAIPSIHGYHGDCDSLCVYDTLKDDGSYICKK